MVGTRATEPRLRAGTGFRRGHHPRHPFLWWTVPPPAGLLVLCAGLLVGACGGSYFDKPVEERLPYIQDPNFKIRNLSADRASATGIACAGTQREAVLLARRTAHYNLRGVTGNARYRIRYALPRPLPEKGEFCVEVEATAER